MMSIVDAPIEKTKVKIDPEILEKFRKRGRLLFTAASKTTKMDSQEQLEFEYGNPRFYWITTPIIGANC
jgi:hypothetical protein